MQISDIIVGNPTESSLSGVLLGREGRGQAPRILGLEPPLLFMTLSTRLHLQHLTVTVVDVNNSFTNCHCNVM